METHKSEDPRDMTRKNIKFQQITDETGTYIYNAAQAVSNNLEPLCKNEYTINDTQIFSQELSTLPPLGEDGEDISYNVESLCNKIPVKIEKSNTNLHEVKI